MKLDDNQKNLPSKIATGDGDGEESAYFDGLKANNNDPFISKKKPFGVIHMDFAENQLCFDVIQHWIVRNPTASICTPKGVTVFQEIANFQDYHGLPEFRNAVSRFMVKVRGDQIEFDPNRIVMSSGANRAHELMAFCLYY